MKEFRIVFEGRQEYAQGVFYPITLKVSAPTESREDIWEGLCAANQAEGGHRKYEVNHIISITEVHADGETGRAGEEAPRSVGRL